MLDEAGAELVYPTQGLTYVVMSWMTQLSRGSWWHNIFQSVHIYI